MTKTLSCNLSSVDALGAAINLRLVEGFGDHQQEHAGRCVLQMDENQTNLTNVCSRNLSLLVRLLILPGGEQLVPVLR